MKKIFWIIEIIVIMLGVSIWIFSLNKNNNSNYQAQRSSTDFNNTTGTDTSKSTIEYSEMEIASFSTKIHNKEESRQNNIRITCNLLTDTELKPGEEFSFCDIVGKATKEKGYQEADVYVDGEKQQGLGGGNCQVSTTLYNAVIQVEGLEIVERHEHSGYVPYIENGKDAAVAYGSYDFKFKNNTTNSIKILMECGENEIIAKLIKKSPSR